MDEQLTICTIIAKNYISSARVLCRSFLEQHPDGKCYVLIIDEFEGYFDQAKEPFETVELRQLNVRKLQNMCFRYNIFELATAAKPYLLQYLLDSRHMQKLCYFDPDILITNKLDDLFKELDNFDFIITPHLDKDYPDDGAVPNDSTIMRHGIFNLGFIGVRKHEDASRFLLWWQHKLYTKCLQDYARGYYVDQKFMDLAITLFPNHKIIHDTGYNVAYWNLHSRTVNLLHGSWHCNNGKLYFFHFSSYKPEKPDDISTNENRHTLKDVPDLTLLFAAYNRLLINNGYRESRTWPYSYNRFKNGKLITRVHRRLYRSNLIDIAERDPFDSNSYPILFKLLSVILNILDKGAMMGYRILLSVYHRSRKRGRGRCR